LMVSIGANDIGFGRIVAFCLFQPHCQSQHFNPKFPVTEADESRPTLEQWVNDQLATLPAAYARLDSALRPLVDPNRVVIVSYFDASTGANGIDCSYLGVKPDEWRWAREHVVGPLNQQVEAAAAAHGWKVVTGVAEDFQENGVCAQP